MNNIRAAHEEEQREARIAQINAHVQAFQQETLRLEQDYAKRQARIDRHCNLALAVVWGIAGIWILFAIISFLRRL